MKLFSWLVLAAAAVAGWWWWRKRHGPALAPPAAAVVDAPVSTAAAVAGLLSNPAPAALVCPVGKTRMRVQTSIRADGSRFGPYAYQCCVQGKNAAGKLRTTCTDDPLPPVGHGVTAPLAIVNGTKAAAFAGGPETLSAPNLKPAPTAAPAGTTAAPLLPAVKTTAQIVADNELRKRLAFGGLL